MSVLNDVDIQMLQGDIDALKLEMDRRITDITARVQRKVDCSPFYTLKDDLDRVLKHMQNVIDDHHIKLEVLEKELMRVQQQNESILSIIAIYNKSIKAE